MLDPHDIELALAASWPALETVVDGGWEARFARGYSGRSNAIQVLDPTDDADPAPRLARMSALYRARGLAPMIKVTPLMGAQTRAAVDALGWALHHDSVVLAATAADLRIGGYGSGTVAVIAPTDARWLDAQAQLQAYPPDTRVILAEMAAQLPASAAGFVLADADGTPIASGLCAVARDVMVPLNVIVAASARGQGHGRRLMAAMLDWGLEQGAAAAAIQTMRTNAPAVSLYQSLGFAFCFPYHYRREETAP